MHSAVLLGISALVVVAHSSPIKVEEAAPQGVSLRLRRGDHNGPFTKRSDITLNANNKWWVTLGLGTPPQDINFLGDSDANGFAVLSTLGGAKGLGTDAILYDPSKSSTAVELDGYTYSQCFSSGCLTGPVYNESITMGGQVFSNVPMGVINHSDNPVGDGDRSGNIGLSPSYTGAPTDPGGLPSFLQAISSELPQGLVAYTYNWDLNDGALDFGWIDSSKYTGALTKLNTQGSGGWNVHFDGVVINGSLVSTPFDGEFDHGSSYSIFPKATLDAYFAQVQGAVWNSDAKTYQFPCDADLPNFTLSVGLLALTVPTVIWKGTPIDGANTCQCAYSQADSEDTAYIGFTWLAGVYIAFDQDNLTVRLANRPALSTNVPNTSVAGTTKFCTGTDFSGSCVEAQWLSNTCGSLSGTSYYKNVGSFSPDHGYCTLYQDTGCTSPLGYAAAVSSPGQSNTYGDGSLVEAYACFYPSDYPPRVNGTLQVCDQAGYNGNCEDINWNSFECHNLDSSFSKNFQSASPQPEGYCYFFLNQGCTGPIYDGAPFVNGGPGDTPIGQRVQSFMCV